MLHPNFVLLGIFLNFLGGLDYLLKTLKGQVKPNKVTWLLWTIAPMTAFFAELQKGVGIQSLMTFMVGFVPLLVFIASFVNKRAEWKLGKFDVLCGVLSFVGLTLWYLTREANFAILFALLADGLAAAPTVLKSYQHPETEGYLVYLSFAVSGGLTLLTITTWNFAHYGFPLYILLLNLTLFFLIKFKIGKK